MIYYLSVYRIQPCPNDTITKHAFVNEMVIVDESSPLFAANILIRDDSKNDASSVLARVPPNSRINKTNNTFRETILGAKFNRFMNRNINSEESKCHGCLLGERWHERDHHQTQIDRAKTILTTEKWFLAVLDELPECSTRKLWNEYVKQHFVSQLAFVFCRESIR